ncbi:MAG: radical SAM protein [archaeon]|nr:radical SAM protein [archaeon]
MIKPTLDCNLRCRHCYHGDCEPAYGVMDIGLYKRVVSLVSESYDSAMFVWHGGEPLMMQTAFFKNAIDVQKKCFGGRTCGNVIRTNGTLLNSRFIRFCKNNRVSIGVSYEVGFERGLRPNLDVKFVDSMVSYMVKDGCASFVSATIHRGNVDDMKKIYQRVRTMKLPLSFNPVINLGNARKYPELMLDADEYAQRLIEIYDVWLHDSTTCTPIVPFTQYISAIMNRSQSIFDCPHSSCLMKWISVYPNGDVYPCGKACPKTFFMGNISRIERIRDLFESDGFRRILVGSIERRKKCQSCEVYGYCNGECSIDTMADGNIEDNDGFPCKVYKKIFKHIKMTLDNIMEMKPSLSGYNRFVRDSVVGRLVDPLMGDTTYPR